VPTAEELAQAIAELDQQMEVLTHGKK
jgi:transketolase